MTLTTFWLALLVCTPVPAADDSWLKEMPSAAQVKRDIRGSSANDTAARQLATFDILTQMATVRIGRLDVLTNLGSLPAAEQQLLRSYRNAKLDLYDATEKSLYDPKCRGPNCPDAVFPQTAAKYLGSQDLRNEITNRYFDRQWMADYARASAAIAAARTSPGAEPPAGPPGPNVLDAIADFLMNAWEAILFGGLLLLWWRRRRKRSHAIEEKKRIPAEELRKRTAAELAQLGATPDARTAKIEDLFNRKSESISVDLKEYDQHGNVVLQGQLVRSIAAMPPRERETLRAAYHLFTMGVLAPGNFQLIRLALLFGDGKGQVFNPRFVRNDTTNDFQAAVKNYTGMTAESAVSTVLSCLESVVKNQPDDPTVKLLAGRLLGGGEAALSSADEFASAQNAQSRTALILGSTENNGRPVTYTGEGSVITVAPPGSGKTQCHVFPTLLSWRGPAVVLDVKGEIYAGTSKWRKENVGPVYKFAPLDPSTSSSYNPLSAVRSNHDFLWEDSRFLADMMLVPSESKDPFWENRARDVLTAAIARACLSDDPAKRSLGNVLDIFHGVGWDPFVRELQARVDIRSMMRAGASLGEMEKKTRDGVLQTGLSSLSAWDGDRIERTTRKSDWNPLDLRSGANPTIYICLKPNEVESYISVLRVFIAQHIRMLTASLPPQGSPPILFVLDELPRLRHMPPGGRGARNRPAIWHPPLDVHAEPWPARERLSERRRHGRKLRRPHVHEPEPARRDGAETFGRDRIPGRGARQFASEDRRGAGSGRPRLQGFRPRHGVRLQAVPSEEAFRLSGSGNQGAHGKPDAGITNEISEGRGCRKQIISIAKLRGSPGSARPQKRRCSRRPRRSKRSGRPTRWKPRTGRSNCSSNWTRPIANSTGSKPISGVWSSCAKKKTAQRRNRRKNGEPPQPSEQQGKDDLQKQERERAEALQKEEQQKAEALANEERQKAEIAEKERQAKDEIRQTEDERAREIEARHEREMEELRQDQDRQRREMEESLRQRQTEEARIQQLLAEQELIHARQMADLREQHEREQREREERDRQEKEREPAGSRERLERDQLEREQREREERERRERELAARQALEREAIAMGRGY